MENKTLISLIEKYFNNTISEQEFDALDKLLKKSEHAQVFKELAKTNYLNKTKGKYFDAEKHLEKSLTQIKFKQDRKVFSLKPIAKYAAAAAIVIGVAFSYFNWQSNINSVMVADEEPLEAIELILNDGSKQLLKTSQKESAIVVANGIQGIVNQDKLHYNATTKTNTLVYNTLKVPYGQRFKIELSDGTLVHLNAGSELKYPVSFIENEHREVFLNGEAFFDVVKNNGQRFFVNTGTMNVEVLGTQFNVSSYQEDQVIKTTLVEGSVKVFENEHPEKQLLLVPNEQASWHKLDHTIDKKEVDVTPHIAWLNGRLIFKKTDFSTISKRLERQYNVVIINKNKKLNTKKFTAHFKEETIEEIIKSFSDNYEFKYIIDGKTIVIED